MSARLQRCWRLLGWELAALLRQRLLWVLGLALVALVAGSVALSRFNFGEETPRFLLSFARAATLWVGTLFATLAAPSLVIQGVESRTTELLLVHGARRAEVVLAQFGAVAIGLGWLLVSVVLVATVTWCSLGVRIGPAMVATGLAPTLLPLLMVAAAAMAAATISRTVLLAASLTLAFACAGHFAPVLAEVRGQSSGFTWLLWSALDALVPNFAAAVAGGVVGLMYAVAYSGVLLLGAAMIFARREF